MTNEKKNFDLNKDNKQDLDDVKTALWLLLQVAIKHPLFVLVFICVTIILQTRANAAQMEAILRIIASNSTNLLTIALIVLALIFAGVALHQRVTKS